MGRWTFRSSVLRARALEHLMIVAWLFSAEAPFLLTLVPVPSVSIGNEISGAFLLPFLTLSRGVVVASPLELRVDFG